MHVKVGLETGPLPCGQLMPTASVRHWPCGQLVMPTCRRPLIGRRYYDSANGPNRTWLLRIPRLLASGPWRFVAVRIARCSMLIHVVPCCSCNSRVVKMLGMGMDLPSTLGWKSQVSSYVQAKDLRTRTRSQRCSGEAEEIEHSLQVVKPKSLSFFSHWGQGHCPHSHYGQRQNRPCFFHPTVFTCFYPGITGISHKKHQKILKPNNT